MAKRKLMTKKQRRTLATIFASMIALIALILAFLLVRNFIRQNSSLAQPPIQVKSIRQQHEEFIQSIAPAAVNSSHNYGILPSITIAQAILESDWGQSQLASNYHNLFGIKSDNPNNPKQQYLLQYTQARVAEQLGKQDIALTLLTGLNNQQQSITLLQWEPELLFDIKRSLLKLIKQKNSQKDNNKNFGEKIEELQQIGRASCRERV